MANEYPAIQNPEAAREWLNANPDKHEAFDRKYGPRTAESILGQATAAAPTAAAPAAPTAASAPAAPAAQSVPTEAAPQGEAPQEEQGGGGSSLLNGLIDGAKGVLNGVEQGINEGVESVQSLGTAIEEGAASIGIPTRVQILDKEGNLDLQLQTPQEAREAGIPEPRILPELDFIDSPQSVGGKLSEGISQFFTGFLISRRATGLRGLKGEMINGAVADGTFFDPLEGNLSTFMEENEIAIPMITEALSVDPDDPEWLGRVKNAGEGLLIGGAIEGTLRGLRALARLRKARETGDKAAEEAASQEIETAAIEMEDAKEAGTFFDETPAPEAPKEEGITKEAAEVADDVEGLEVEISAQTFKETSDVATEIVNKGASQKAGGYIDGAKLKEFVDLRGAVNPDDLTAPSATWFNYRKMDGPIEGQQVIETMAIALEDSGAMKQFGIDKPETLAKTYKDAAALVGSEIGTFTRGIEKLAADTVGQARQVVAGKMVLQTLGREINRLATEVDVRAMAGKGSEEIETKLLQLMDTHHQVQLHLKAVQTAAARATSAGRIRTADSVSTAALDRLQQVGGSARVRQLAKRLRAAAGENQMAQLIRHANKKGAWDVINEYWINAILSGPKTHAVNITSNAINTVLLPVERIMGGALTMDARQLRLGASQVRHYMSLRTTVFDSLRLAGKAFWQEGNILDSVAKVEGDFTSNKAITGQNFGFQAGSKRSALADGMGKMLRLPSRFLMAEDEFFKQMNFRSNLMAELSVTAADLTAAQIQKMGFTSKGDFIQSEFTKAFNDLGDAEVEWQKLVDLGKVQDDPAIKERFINQSIGTFKASNKNAATAIRNARAATFTTPLDPSSTDTLTRFSADYQRLANRHPFLRQITPFIQTPVNILSVAWDRTPAMNLLRSQFRQRLASADPSVRAEAAGQLATSVALGTAVSMLAYEGRITGGGPTDGKQRAMWQQDPNWQPYSINIGSVEEPEWVAYERLDPHGFLFGIVGDIVEMQQAAEMDPSFDGVTAFSMTVAAITNNITSKTWLQGVSEVVEILNSKDQPWKAQQWLNGKAASFMPYSSAVRQVQDGSDPVMREARTFVDAMKKTTPGMAGDLAVRHDWLTGDAVETPSNLLGYIRSNSNARDPVAEEMRNLQYGFSGPDRKLGQVNLSSAQYHEWSKLMGKVRLGGKTLHQQIEALMKRPEYDFNRDSVPDAIGRPAESHRVRMIAQVISQYKAASKQLLLEGDPALKKAFREFKIFEKKANAGRAEPGARDGLFLDFR